MFNESKEGLYRQIDLSILSILYDLISFDLILSTFIKYD